MRRPHNDEKNSDNYSMFLGCEITRIAVERTSAHVDAVTVLCLDSHMRARQFTGTCHLAALLLLLVLLPGVLSRAESVAAAVGTPFLQEPDCLTVAQIQGVGAFSALDGRVGLACVRGCVTGVAADGFYIQSDSPDADPKTSEGIFVYRWSGWENPRRLQPGDLLEIRNFGVQEFYASTEIVKLKSDRDTAYRRVGRCKLPAPVVIEPPVDPALDPEPILERYEGMRVALDVDGYVSGPTTRYVSRFPSGDPEIAIVPLHSPLAGRRIFAGEVPVGRGMVYLSGGLGRDLPDVRVNDRLTASALTGILAFQFGRYVLLVDQDPSQIAVQRASDAAPDTLAPGPDEFGVCSFNVENLYDATDDGDGDLGDWSPADEDDFELRLEKRARAIRENLKGCAVVGLQEVEGKDTVWARLAATAGDYAYDYFESADARDITVGILYDPARVTVNHSEPSQSCSETDFGVSYEHAGGERARPNPCTAGLPVFDRPPYVADLTIRSAAGSDALDLRVIVNHFKSRRGDETENSRQRLAQAQHVAQMMNGPRRIALGDFNDTPDSDPIRQFSALADLYNTHVLRAEAYTYIYNGLSETPDYAFASLDLLPYIEAVGPVHINADYPDVLLPDRSSRRSSDHDPLIVRFTLDPHSIVLDWRRFYEGRWRQNQSLRLKKSTSPALTTTIRPNANGYPHFWPSSGMKRKFMP